MAKNLIISGIVEEKRHSLRISVSDSLYKAIKYHAVKRNFTTAEAAEDMLEKSVLNLPIIYDLHANEETNTINNIKYYLEEIKKDVKYSVLMVHDKSYSHVAEDFISFLEPLSSNPMSCFNSCNLAIIEKEYMNILLAAYRAGLRTGISIFPLEESYFYRFLHLCRRGGENKNGIKNEYANKKNIEYVLDTENHFYHWVLNLEFKHSTDEYKLNSSEMRFLLEVSDFNYFLRFFISNSIVSKADFENAENRIARYIEFLKNKEYRKSLGINTNERIQAWINYISSEEYLKKLEEIKTHSYKDV